VIVRCPAAEATSLLQARILAGEAV